MTLYANISDFKPFNEQERTDKEIMLKILARDSDCFQRNALAHFTCSAWTMDETLEKTLLVHHNVYDSWSWIGGHADGDRNLAAVALRELEEETGVSKARLANCGAGGILSLEILTVNGHEKRGAYIGSHLHLNVTYLAIADPNAPVRPKFDENNAVKWVNAEDAIALSSEPWIRERIYRKLLEKIDRIRESATFEPTNLK